MHELKSPKTHFILVWEQYLKPSLFENIFKTCKFLRFGSTRALQSANFGLENPKKANLETNSPIFMTVH